MSNATKTGNQVGQTAPDFALPDQDEHLVRLSDYRGKQPVVLFFYPKDHSPVCTQEACAFRDAYERFLEMGAEVIGISADSAKSHRSFAQRNRLPYRLLADTDSAVHALYGAKTLFGLMNNRVTFIIDRQGVIRHRFSDMMNGTAHVDEMLRVLQSL
ncbi:MAG: peroxiredoxin [Anaerolineae bacterium]|nr:peroxiredoxin [Anaerolineae bacterium]MDW8171871.1 peroxiredoxin [Anaerolineae bacterium]